MELNWTYTNDIETASEWLANLPNSLIACDFEVAPSWDSEEQSLFKSRAKFAPKRIRAKLLQKANADGLSHPALTSITHFSCAWSPTDAFVIILDSDELLYNVLNWLVTDSRYQIWHNASFDFRHIMHNTNKLPINFDDTQILAKTLLNHVDVYKANTGLKQLMGWEYGDWAMSELAFTKDNMYDERMLKYACIDAMATYKLYLDIQEDINDSKQP